MLDEYKYGYYQTLRLDARSKVVDALNRRSKQQPDKETWRGLSLASISQKATDYARLEWAKYYDGENRQPFAYSWEHLFLSYSMIPANFNIAVWQTVDGQEILRGMALGRPSKAMRHLSINWLERSYVQPKFKGGVLLPILASAEVYAKLLGCDRVLIKNAVDPSAFGQYGYAPSDQTPKGASYLSKEL